MGKGKTIKNPQSGAMIELPGKKVGTISIVSSFGDDEFSEIMHRELPIIQVQKLDDFKQIAGKIIENELFRKLIIEKIPEELNNYLSYQNHSSSRILELIDNKN